MACFVPDKLDAEIAKLVDGWNAHDVSCLRGMWEEQNKKEFKRENLQEAAIKLAQYRASILTKEMNSASSNLTRSYKSLSDLYDAIPQTRVDRVNMIAELFSRALDFYQNYRPDLSREDLAKGIQEGDTFVGGQFAIFNAVFDQLREQYSNFKADGKDYEANEIAKILDNWGAFTALARVRLRDTEGIKLGTRVDYATSVDEFSFGENDIALLYNPEESTRESWQLTNDMISAYGTLGVHVRRVLGSICLYNSEKNDVERDDLGFAKKINPIIAHQILSEEIGSCVGEEDMMNTLKHSNYSWMTQLVTVLESDPLLRTQFYTNFNKDNQLYKQIKHTVLDGIHTFKTSILNKLMNPLVKRYKASIKAGKSLSDTSVFDTQGNVSWVNVQRFVDTVKGLFNQETTGSFAGVEIKENSDFWKKDFAPKRAKTLSSLLRDIGIDISEDGANVILNSNKAVAVTKALLELASYGFNSYLTKNIKNELDAASSEGRTPNISSTSYRELYAKRTKSQQNTGSKKGNIEEKTEDILRLISSSKEALQYESRALRKDRSGKYKTLYSRVYPSFLGSFVKKINRFFNTGSLTSLRNWLDNTYGKSSMFKLNGKWLNRWMNDWYNDPFDKAGNFAQLFNYTRFLGSEITDFEDFTSKQHAISMMQDFAFADNLKDSEGRRYANYPVFILGDSGVCKTVRAKVYSEDEIIDGFYDVYQSEVRKQELAKAALEKMRSEGTKPNVHLESMSKDFTILSFLNDQTIQNFIRNRVESGVSEEKAIKDSIKAYLEKSLDTFKQDLLELGVLDAINEDNKAVSSYLNSAVNSAKGSNKNYTLDDFIKEFYYNTKFATCMQMQIMTIDTGFYKGTDDLQKRFKEIHAPGTPLSIEAQDKEGNSVSPLGIESCIYAEDITMNAENFNPEFMAAIENKYGKNSPQYQAYTKTNGTDGQGFRTLDSYRSVLIMSGQWYLNPDYERAYKRIKEIRAEYNGKALPKEVLDEMSQLAVVFMPIKPFLFTHERYTVNDNDCLYIPVQHKYAEAVLIPELMNDGILKSLALAMENHKDSEGRPDPIDMVCFESCVKVGSFGATSFKDASEQKDITDAVNKAYVHRLNYSDYRIQTNVPAHISGERLFATQIRKLIMAGINMNDDHYASYFNGQKINIGGGNIVTANGRNLLNLYNGLIVANILDSYEDFEKEVKNPQKLANLLQQAVVNNDRESWDNLYAYSIEEGVFDFPIFEGSIEHDSASLILSLFRNRVNKQKINGGSLVQVSSIGADGYQEDGNLSFVCSDSEGNIIRVNDANYEDKKNSITNVLYAEAEVPFDLTVNINGKEVPLEYSDWVNPDRTLRLDDEDGIPLLEKAYPGILDRIAYRIPTERDYSMLNIKVTRFSPRVEGGTIKVPAQGVTIAGFDFDIDKLYFMMREYHYEVDKDSKLLQDVAKALSHSDLMREIGVENQIANANKLLKYDISKSPMDQHKNKRIATALRNNMLIDLIQKRLEDPETFRERTTPGGFPNCSKAARAIRELEYGPIEDFSSNGKVNINKLEQRSSKKELDPRPNYDFSDPMTIIRYNQQNQVAAKLIGIYANMNTNHAFSSLLHKLQLNVPIEFAGHTKEEGYGVDLLHGPAGVDVSGNMAELLASSVDAVKDPVLNFLNLNTATAQAGGLLMRLGYSPFEVGLLLNQPAIKEACQYAFNNNIRMEDAVSELISVYKRNLSNRGEAPSNIFKPSDFTKETLISEIVKDRRLRESQRNTTVGNISNQQLKTLLFFQSINTSAKEVSEFISTTKFTAANAVGSTFGHLYAQQQKVSYYLEHKHDKDKRLIVELTETLGGPINNNPELTSMSKEDYFWNLIIAESGNPFAYEQAMFDMNRKVLSLLSEYYPYETALYKKVRNMATKVSRNSNLNEDTINQLHRELPIYLLSNMDGSPFNPDGESDYGQGFTNRQFYLNKFPELLRETLRDNPDYISRYSLFSFLSEEEDSDGSIKLVINEVGGLTTADKESIRDSWKALLKEDPDLAKCLFMYSYYQNGFTFRHNGFMHLAPVAVKKEITVKNGLSYQNFLKAILKGWYDTETIEYVKQFIKLHYDNPAFTYTARGELGRSLKQKALQNSVWQKSFEVDLSNTTYGSTLVTGGDKQSTSTVPCIRFQEGYSDIVYIADCETPYNGEFNRTSGTVMRYVKVDNLDYYTKNGYAGSSKGPEIKLRAPEEGSTFNPDDYMKEGKLDRDAVMDKIINIGIASFQASSDNNVILDVEGVTNALKQELGALNDTELLGQLESLYKEFEKDNSVTDDTGKKAC